MMIVIGDFNAEINDQIIRKVNALINAALKPSNYLLLRLLNKSIVSRCCSVKPVIIVKFNTMPP